MISDLPIGSYRFRENFASPDVRKLCRLPGFETLLFGNLDLHDQLLPLQTYFENKRPPVKGADDITKYPNSTKCLSQLLTRTQGRERITFGFEFESLGGAKKLIACTQSRIYLGNLNTGNYRILGDGFGGNYDAALNTRFSAAVLNDVAVFTNDFNEVVYWNLNGAASGCEMQSVRKVPSLLAIGVNSAAIAIEFGGTMLLMNVVMNGKRYGNRILSSDFGDATAFDPAQVDSITSLETLPNSSGETILAAAKLGDDQLIVYTDKGIYVGGETGNPDDPLEFVKHYTPESDNRCLKYKNTLVNTGVTHIYMGSDSIYVFTPYRRDPEMVTWIHNASGVIYEGIDGYPKINALNCACHVGGFDSNTKNVWFSWAATGSNVPSKSMIFNLDTEFASLVDVGFTCFFRYTPDYRPLFRDWLLENCSCAINELADLGMGFVKEGQPVVELCTGSNPESIWTNTVGTTYGVTTEDWTRGQADSTSLCALLDGKFLNDFCRQCAGTSLFIGAYSDDWCLKQIGTAYSRQVCTNFDTSTGPGTDYENVNGVYYSFDGAYEYVGYNSVIRSTGNTFGSLQLEKSIDRIYLELTAEDQVSPCVVSMRVGASFTARDPNDPVCGIIWSKPVRKYFKCPLRKTIAEYIAQHLRPTVGTEFPIGKTGVYLYWELTIASLSDQSDLKSALVPGIGGSGCLGLLTTNVTADSPTEKS